MLGRFVYDGNNRVEIEDRTLAHLQMTVGAKLRRGEAFFFTWKDDLSVGKGRTTVWMHAGASLVFTFHGSRTPQINRAWLEALMYTANSPTGLYVVPEPAESSTDKLGIE